MIGIASFKKVYPLDTSLNLVSFNKKKEEKKMFDVVAVFLCVILEDGFG